MKKYFVFSSVAVVTAAAFFSLGYYTGSGKHPSQKERGASLVNAHSLNSNSEGKETSIAPRSANETVDIRSAKMKKTAEQTAAETVRTVLPVKPEPQNISGRQEIIASVRVSGVPEEDIERVTNSLMEMNGHTISTPDDQPQLTDQELEERDAFVRSEVYVSDVPEEDVERVVRSLTSGLRLNELDIQEKSREEMQAEAFDSAIEGGVPDEDVERVAESLTDIVPQEPQEYTVTERQAEKIAEIAASVRDAGVPEEDVERVAESLALMELSGTGILPEE